MSTQIFLLILVGGVFALTVLMRRRANLLDSETANPFQAAEMSLTRYQVMNRLLAPEDFEFLEKQPGSTPEVLRQFRKERRQILRMYLDRLVLDYRRVHGALRMLSAESEYDRTELARELFWSQLRFTAAVQMVRVQIVLHAMGVSHVDVTAVLSQAVHSHARLRQMVEPITLAG